MLGRPSFNTNWNWGPRLGFAWNVGGNQRTVVRGGYGIAYDFIYLNPITNQRFLPPFMITGSLSDPSQFTGGNAFANLMAGTSQIQRETLAQIGQVSQTVRNFGSVSPLIEMGMRNPQTHQWSLELQQELAYGVVTKMRYLGTKSNYLQRSSMVNPINRALVRPATSVDDETARLTEFRALQAGQSGGATTQSNRIDPRFNDSLLVDSSANSNFHSFQAEVQKRLSAGFWLQASYSWAKSIDDASDALGVLINDNQLQQDPFHHRLDRAPSQFDIRHKFSLVHSWEPTWGRDREGFVRQLISGWGFSGISQLRTGYPVHLLAGPRRGISNSPLFGYNTAAVRPNAAGPFEFNPRATGSEGAPQGLNSDPVQPISTYAAALGLSQPLIGNIGTLGRNTHRLDGFVNFDWNVYKTFRISESLSTQVRSEFYNVFNNVNFQDVNRTITSPAFGQYTTVANDARFIQLALRIIW